MTTRRVRLGLVQMRCDDTSESNLSRAIQGVDEAVRRGAGVVALPELFLGPYFCQRKDDRTAFDRAEPIPGPTTEHLAKVAKQHKITLVGGSVFEKTSEGKFFNTACVFGPDGTMIGSYRKTHIPEDILYHEQHYFAPGDTGIRIFDAPSARIAPLICYDQWYPEAARIATLSGAELLVYPTAIGVIDTDVEENITGDWEQMWRNAQIGHAAVNNVYVAAINRVGREGAITFWGGSFIVGPAGDIMAKAGNQEEVILADLDLSRVPALQQAWRFLANRRPQMYKKLIEGT